MRYFPGLDKFNILTWSSNYECKDNAGDYLTIADGVNNLSSIGWGTRIRSLRCRNFDPSIS